MGTMLPLLLLAWWCTRRCETQGSINGSGCDSCNSVVITVAAGAIHCLLQLQQSALFLRPSASFGALVNAGLRKFGHRYEHCRWYNGRQQ